MKTAGIFYQILFVLSRYDIVLPYNQHHNCNAVENFICLHFDTHYINSRRSKILRPCIFDTPRIRARRKPCIREKVLRLTLLCVAEPLGFSGARKKYKTWFLRICPWLAGWALFCQRCRSELGLWHGALLLAVQTWLSDVYRHYAYADRWQWALCVVGCH